MKESIKKRIESVRRGEVPEGYRRAKDIGIAPQIGKWVSCPTYCTMNQDRFPNPIIHTGD